jgi:hypothetical protein
MTKNNEQEFRTSAATMRLIAPNIIETFIHDGTVLAENDLLEIKQINVQLTEGMPYGVLVVPGAGATVTKEGRQLSASSDYKQQTKAVAMLVRSPHHRAIFNFYTKLNKPKTMIQMFSARTQAVEWLKKQLA